MRHFSSCTQLPIYKIEIESLHHCKAALGMSLVKVIGLRSHSNRGHLEFMDVLFGKILGMLKGWN